jgi:hypothetical protein
VLLDQLFRYVSVALAIHHPSPRGCLANDRQGIRFPSASRLSPTTMRTRCRLRGELRPASACEPANLGLEASSIAFRLPRRGKLRRKSIFQADGNARPSIDIAPSRAWRLNQMG